MSIVKNLTKVKPSEIKQLVRIFINRNRELQNEGKIPNTICFLGAAGISKTSCISQVAKELNAGYAKVSLANIDEAGELLGHPLKEYELQKGDEKKWVSEKEYDITVKHGWEPTYNNRTGYAPPAWLSKLQKHETSILLLDDFNRCLQHFQNSIMEIN